MIDPQLYNMLRRMDEEDRRRATLATMSPLLLAMHLDDEVRAFRHMQYLDAHVVALVNLQLYPDGPGPAPEVWVREQEGVGDWLFIGTGFTVAVSDEAYESDEMLLLRPGAAQEFGGPEEAPNEDRVALRLAIALPPRHGKSLLVTEHLPLWFLLRHPDNSVVVSTYNTTFAEKWGGSLQEKMPDIRGKLPLATDGQELSPINSTRADISFRPGKDRGEINFRGVGGTLTGTGWGLGIIDDPFKDQTDALSETIRETKKDWYTSTFSNRRTRRRGSPPPLEVMMFTRWHEDDLAGAFAYEEDGETPKPGWCVLRLAAIAEDGDPLGRKPGQSLCPTLKPLDELLAEQEQDPTWFSALYQGRPTHAQGGMFAKTREVEGGEPTYWHYRERDGHFHGPNGVVAKNDLLCFVTMDTAASERTTADWTVASLWGWSNDLKTLILIDRKRERVTTEKHHEWLREFIARRPDLDVSFTGIENKTFGTTLINQMRRDDPEMVIIPIKADRDKVTRATNYANAVVGGKVWFPDPATCSWSVIWENEHVNFPNAKHDDQVDTGSMAWTQAQNYRYDDPKPKQPPQEKTHVRKGFAQIARKRGRKAHDYEALAKRI